MRHFLVDFFFGPCLDISAVDPRQDQEAPHQHRRRSNNRNSNHQVRRQQSSSTTTTKPRKRNSERRLHDNGSTEKNRVKSRNKAALSLDLVRLHTPTRNSPRGKSIKTTRRRRKRGDGILSKYNNGGNASKYAHLSSRNDDASVMTASLVETYRAYSTEKNTHNENSTTSEEYLEEQSVIRRSLKDYASAGSTTNHRGENKKKKEVALRLKSITEYNEHDDDHAITSAQQQSQRISTSTNKSELANWIEKTTTPQCTAATNIDYDNVTTISQASKNPYSVLGVSQHSSSRVIDLSYQAKIKDAKVQQQQHQIQQQQQQRGGHYQGEEGENKYNISEKAIADVTNAYRRIKADVQRQEQEEILRQQQNRLSSQRKNTNGNDSSRQRQRSTTFTDSYQRRVNINSSSSSSSQKNTHHIKYNNKNHTDDIDDQEEEEEDNSSSSAKTRISKRLKDHRELVHDLFAKHDKRSSKNNINGTKSSSEDDDGFGGKSSQVTKTTNAATSITTLQQSIINQGKAIAEMKLVPIEAGANNINEQKQTIQNNCFYLSLAASYLCGVGAFDNVNESNITTTTATTAKTVRDNTTSTTNNHNTIDNGVDHHGSSTTIAVLEKRQKVITMNLALQLKRAIESAVLLVHPEWAKSGMVGEEVQAFSDFLVYALDSNSVLGHWAIGMYEL